MTYSSGRFPLHGRLEEGATDVDVVSIIDSTTSNLESQINQKVPFNSPASGGQVVQNQVVVQTVVSTTNQTLTGTLSVQGTTTLAAANISTLSLGSGTTILAINTYSQTITPAAISGIGFSEQTFTVVGLATNDKVYVNAPAPAANVAVIGARVSAVNTLALQFFNATAGPNTPTSGTHTIVAVRS
jgi:filamentous hemagglutinin family protein